MLCIEITDCRGIFQCGSNKWIQIYMNAIHSISSSSSDTVQGSVLLPHYRTLEVRPGRIS